MIINHNLGALNAIRLLGQNQVTLNGALEKLSSGMRINRAADDAAGLAISQKMQAQINGLTQASQNSQDGISLIQTAEGALNETQSILQRMRDLSVQAANDTMTTTDRQATQSEITQLQSEIDNIANTTQFNGKNLLDGSLQSATSAQGNILESIKLGQAATQGAVEAQYSVAASTKIVTGVNDKLHIQVNGGASGTIVLAAGTYTATGLVGAVNAAISSSSFAGKVTTSLDSTNKLILTSNTQGSNSSVKVLSVPAGSGTDAESAALALGFGTASGGTKTVAKGGSGLMTLGTTGTIHVTVGSRTGTITVTTASGTSATAVLNSIQRQLDSKFGTGTITATKVGTTGILNLTANVGVERVKFTGSMSGVKTAAAGVSGSHTGISTSLQVTTGVSSGAITNTTKLITLGNSSTTNGNTTHNSLGLAVGNVINISATVNGRAINGAFTVTGAATVNQLLGSIQTTLGHGAAVTMNGNGEIQVAGSLGTANAVENVALSVQQSATNTAAGSNSFNNQLGLGTFEETQVAQDQHSDSSLTFQIGANEGQTMKISVNRMDAQQLGIQSINLTTQQGAQTAQTVLENAIETVSTQRANLGALQNRLQHTINYLGTANQNLTDAASKLTDVDMAAEMTQFTKSNILAQAGTAMLAQANQQPQLALKLLG